MAFRVTPDFEAKFNARAIRMKSTTSALARTIIEDWLKNAG